MAFLPALVGAVLAGASAAAGVAAFLGISVTTAFLLTTTATFLGLNYLRNKIPEPGAPAPVDYDYRVSRPASTQPARFIYGRARIGGFPIFLSEFQWNDPQLTGGHKDYQVQVFLTTEGEMGGPLPNRGPVEAVWVNGIRMPFNPALRGGHIRTGSTTVNGQRHYLGSNTHLDDDIALAGTRISTIEAAIPNAANRSPGVNVLLNYLKIERDNLIERRGRRHQFTPRFNSIGPEDGTQWESRLFGTYGVQPNIRVFEHDGTGDHTRFGSILNRMWNWRLRESRGQVRGNVNWPESSTLRGISAVMVELLDPSRGNDTDFLPAPPRVEFLVRGRKITWPGQTTPTWTENAAAVYYDWLVNMLGVDPTTIDTDSFTEAYNYCNELITIPEVERGDEDDTSKTVHANDILAGMFGSDSSDWPPVSVQDVLLAVWNETHAGDDNAQIRYSINGVVETGMDPREVESQFNSAWGGYVVERDGIIYFEPGRDRPISRVFNEESLVGDSPPRWQVEPPHQQRTTSVTCSLTQSNQHDWLTASLPKIALEGVEDSHPQDLGTWTYVAYPATASRLMRQSLMRATGGKAVRMTVGRGDNWANYGIAPTDRVALSMPNEGHSDTAVKWFVNEMSTTMAGTVNLSLSEEKPGTYDDIVTVPLGVESGPVVGGGLGFTRAPPANVTWVRTGIREQVRTGFSYWRSYFEPRIDGVLPDRLVQVEYTYRTVAGTAIERDGEVEPSWRTTRTAIVGDAAGGDFSLVTRVPLLDDPDSSRRFASHEVELRLRFGDGPVPSRWGDVIVVNLAPPVSVPEGLVANGV